MATVGGVGATGRPRKGITRAKLEALQKQNFTAKEMATALNCSTSLIYEKLQGFGIQQRKKYAELTDPELDAITRRLHTSHPNAGLKMMCGFLEGEGYIFQRARVKDSLSRVVGESGVRRKAITRRQYKVASPNSLWHVDAHMKLIRWGISTHGCIDGFSRMVVFLESSTDNKAKTVFNLFLRSVVKYGIPTRVRSDHGFENGLVALFMNFVNGLNHHITGKSVHNQRIERLWYDVHTNVTSTFYATFYELEDSGRLNINNENDIRALHAVFIPEINKNLTTFANGWNKHNIRTAGNKSPEQLWMTGALQTNNGAVNTIRNWSSSSLKEKVQQAMDLYGLQPPVMDNFEDEVTDDISELRDRFQNIFHQNISCTEKFELLKEAIVRAS